MPRTPERKRIHVRLYDHAATVITAMVQPGGLFPAYDGRNFYEAVDKLVRSSPDFQAAEKQLASERNPRPGNKR